jgi:hypothetical protein
MSGPEGDTLANGSALRQTSRFAFRGDQSNEEACHERP